MTDEKRFECPYCLKLSTPRHIELKALRAELVQAIYLMESEFARKKYSPNMFLSNKTLQKLRRRLNATNKELENA